MIYEILFIIFSSFATTSLSKIVNFEFLSIKIFFDCIFKFSDNNGFEKKKKKKVYKKDYFSFICNIPTELNKPIVIIGIQADKDKGILLV